MKLLMLKGLPASGKSTYAKKLAEDGYVRVNKDDLRAMLHASKWSKRNEQQVLRLRDQIITDSLREAKSVVVDDTNLAPKHTEHLKQIAKEHKATFETKFFDVPIEECIKRDLVRLNSVGERVIREMHKQFIADKPLEYMPPSGKPRAILCDIDGTLSHMGERSPYDWHKVGTDNPDKVVIEILRKFNDKAIILMSGRDEICRPETVAWLADNRIPFHHLYMRSENDMRKDNIVKRELFESYIRDNFQVDFVLDDRNQVVEMWRNLGLKVLQVENGDF